MILANWLRFTEQFMFVNTAVNESDRFANCETCDKVRGIVYVCEYCSK